MHLLSWNKWVNARQELEAGAFFVDAVQNNIRQMNALNSREAQFNSEQSHVNYSTPKTGIETEDLLFPEIKEF